MVDQDTFEMAVQLQPDVVVTLTAPDPTPEANDWLVGETE
jgi:hypothetical protein